MKGKAIIFSAPSGAGKTTIVQHLINRIPSLKFSISATTRKKRPKEVDGKDYYFLSIESFRSKVALGEFLEWEEVYSETFYGTLRTEVERIWSEGNHVVFDVDVIGGIRLKEVFGDQALSIFVKVLNVETLANRLAKRNTEDEDSLRKRIEKASKEMSEEHNFDSSVINEDLQKAVEDARVLVEKFIGI